jgi:hypothetical protein
VSDFDLDALLAGAVDDYHRQTLPQIKPAGTTQARATATHRKRVHAMAMSVAALVVVAVPIAAYAATEHNHNGPPQVASSQSASPAPSESPSATPSALPTSPAPTLAPITQQELSNATLDLPSWAGGGGTCPSGTVTLHNGQFGGTSRISVATLIKAVSVDLDGNGSADAVALFGCQAGNPGFDTAIAFHRATDGSIQTLGIVVHGINTLTDIRAGDAGTVQIRVSDLAGSDGYADTEQVLQWRTYQWDGTRFNQAGGSTSFTVSVPTLTATLSDLTFQAPANGKRTGTMTVTLHNGGTTTIDNASVIYDLEIATVIAPKCDQLAADLPVSGQCTVQPITPGATATLTFTLSANASAFPYAGNNYPNQNLIQIRIGDQKLAPQPPMGKLILN